MTKILYLIPVAAVALAGCAPAPVYYGQGAYMNTNGWVAQNGYYAPQAPAYRYYRTTEPVVRDVNGNVMAVGNTNVSRFVRTNYGAYDGTVMWNSARSF